jgi:hypothetical protein
MPYGIKSNPLISATNATIPINYIMKNNSFFALSASILLFLILSCQSVIQPISPDLEAVKRSVYTPQKGASAKVMSASESEIQGLWTLDSWYNSGEYPYYLADYNSAHSTCQLTYVWINFHSTGSGVGTVWRYNGNPCSDQTWSNVSGGANLYYHVTTTLPGETISTYDMGTIYAPLFFERNVGGSPKYDGYNPSVSPDGQTLTLYGTGKALVYVRASGGPSVP